MQDKRLINDLSESEMEYFGQYVRWAHDVVRDWDSQPPRSRPNIVPVTVDTLRALTTIVFILTNTARNASRATVELHDELELRDAMEENTAPSVTVSDIINAHKKKDDGR